MHKTQKVYLNTFLKTNVIAFSRLNKKICFVNIKIKKRKIYKKILQKTIFQNIY